MSAPEKRARGLAHIETTRLTLIALTAEQLGLYLAAPDRLERALGLALSRDVLTGRAVRAIQMKRIKMAAADPADHAWYTYWLLVVAAAGYGAGLAGFKGLPDAAGEVEIGYGLDPAWQGQGYTTEAAKALIGWAFSFPACRAVVAPNTLKSNLASNRVLEKIGMIVYEETADSRSWRIDKTIGA